MTSTAKPSLPELDTLLALRGKPPFTALVVDRRAHGGGLEALLTEEVMARFVDASGRRHSFRFVAKHLRGRAAREAEVYRALLERSVLAPSPRMLGLALDGEGRSVLYLEPIRAAERWPWRLEQRTADVLERMATFHASARECDLVLPHWDYESELAVSAEQTLASLDQTRRAGELSQLARGLPALKRLVLALPEVRRQLFASTFGSTSIHGDLHSGNVLVRQRARGPETVLLDWGRARTGSPLEDVSSWLQSLRCWEPETLRRHDTLLARYLLTLGRSGRIDAETRESYWLSAACNALAGALQHHLWSARYAPSAAARAQGVRGSRDALRVLRRADAIWS